MRGRLPSDVYLSPKDLELLERVFAQVIPEHDTHPDDWRCSWFAFSRTASEMSELLAAAFKWLPAPSPG